MSKKLKPGLGQAVLRPAEDGEQLYGNIVIPDMGQETSRLAVIVDIAPIYNFNLGTMVEPYFKVGDTVLYPPLGGQKIKLDGQDYIVISSMELAASVEDI